jgi:hypothetical protein
LYGANDVTCKISQQQQQQQPKKKKRRKKNLASKFPLRKSA